MPRRAWSDGSRRPARRPSAGPPRWSRCRPVISLSSSPLDLGRMATRQGAAGSGGCGGRPPGVPLGARVSPVRVPASLGSATMSPARPRRPAGASLPRSSCEDVQPLVGVGAGVGEHVVGPDRPRQRPCSSEILPTYGSEKVLNTRASGRPPGRTGPPGRCRRPAPSTGRARVGAGAISASRRARRSMPDPGEPPSRTRTGNTDALRPPRRPGCPPARRARWRRPSR